MADHDCDQDHSHDDDGLDKAEAFADWFGRFSLGIFIATLLGLIVEWLF